MSKHKVLASIFYLALTFMFPVFFVSSNVNAGMVTGSGGGSASSFRPSGGGSGGSINPHASWVYYKILDTSKPAYIYNSYLGNNKSEAASITISDCGQYGGFYVLQAMNTGPSGTLYYRSMGGATTVGNVLASYNAYYIQPEGGLESWSYMNQSPKKGVYTGSYSNAQPFIYNDGSCNSYGNSQYWTCYMPGSAGSGWPANVEWMPKWSTIKEIFKSNNGNSKKCTIGGTTYNDCFGSGSPLAYFCYGNDPSKTFTLSYNANGGSGAPSASSCDTTDSSCNVTVKSGTPTRSGYRFTGWNDRADGTGTARSAGGGITLSGDKTIYAQWALVQTATFTHDTISASSTEASKSGDTFSGDGKSTSYKITVSYKIKRTNDAPSSATSSYAYNAANNDNDSNYPGDSATKSSTGGLTKDGVKTVPVDYTIEVANGSTATKCFFLRYDSSVTYVGGSRESGNFAGKTKKCFSVYNPAKNDTHFTGSISATGSSGLTLVDNSTATTATGNGLRNDFSITPGYTITRLATDGNPASASSNYAYAAASNNNDSNYPGTSATKSSTGGLAKGTSASASNVSATTFTLDIGASAITRCFYLRYDANVTYYDAVRDDDSADFNGKTKKCFTITNPTVYYTATFGNASSSGTLDSHTQLTRTSSNTVGVIDHTTRKTNQTDAYENGRFDDSAYPSSSDYTATFTHTVSRTDTKPSDTVNNVYATSAQTYWQVQYSLNGGSWTNYAKTNDNNGNSATVNGTDSLTDSATKTITVHPKWTMNASNAGQYVYYCQRLAYRTTSKYKTESDGSGYKTTFVGVDNGGYGDYAYSTSACVTLRNPLWTEAQKGSNRVHNISITGATTGINPTGARLRSASNTTAYETTAVNTSFAFDHSLTRTDSGFDESDIVGSDFETSVTKAFFHPSIYSNCNYAVTTKMWGNERMPGTRNNPTLIYPKRSAESTACNNTTKLNAGANGGLVNGFEVQLNATSKTDTSTNRWFSSASNGRTTTAFHADYANTNDYLLLAGQTKQFSQGTYNSNGAEWTVGYKDLVRCETYTSGYFIGSYPTKDPAKDCKYDRTEVVDRSPQAASTPVYHDSDYTTYSLFRPYNYNIADIRPVSAPSSNITYAGQNVKRSFTVSVARKDTTKSYITDLYSPNVYVIGYRILPNQNRTNIQNATVGTSGLANTGNAQTDICTNFYGAANRIGFGNDTNRCSVLTGHTDKLGTKDNQNAYNHVYGYDNTTMSYDYSLTFSTSDIYVPSNLDIGEKYCIAIAVANSTTSSTTGLADSSYYLSKSTCSNIAKLPSTQVLSGSIKTNGGIKSSTSYALQSDNTYLTYGSWADFAVIANKDIAKFASAASIARGITHTTLSTILCNTDHLTIANSQCSGAEQVTALGDSKIISESTTLQKLYSRYVEGRAESILIQQDTLTAGDITAKGLDPNNFFSSHPFVVYSSGDLVISTNILSTTSRTYSQNFTPQAILIAEGNIKIDQTVTNLDAWIVAGGEVDTCTSGHDAISLHSNVCNQQLTIRGTILANKISLKRTYGGDVNTGSINTPAEIIHYTPALMLFTARESERSLLPETTYLHKLPVRY